MKKLVVTLCLILILGMIIIPIKTYGTTINPNDYNPKVHDPGESMKSFTKEVGIIASALKIVGIVVMVITLIVLGIKYMIGSIEERVDYKKSMIPYLIGATLLLTITQVLSIIINLSDDIVENL